MTLNSSSDYMCREQYFNQDFAMANEEEELKTKFNFTELEGGGK